MIIIPYFVVASIKSFFKDKAPIVCKSVCENLAI